MAVYPLRVVDAFDAGFAPVSASALGWCGLAALVGVGWIEGYKAIQPNRP